jgi:23S rRNA (cytosine1962-C5)-methyltransferase
MVVIDPPALAPRAADRESALRVYRRLAESGLELLGREGWLVVASCSSQVSRDDFVGVVTGAAHASGRTIRHTEVFGHAADHPATFPEAHYLKAVFLHARRAAPLRLAGRGRTSRDYPARRRRTPRKNSRSGGNPSR